MRSFLIIIFTFGCSFVIFSPTVVVQAVAVDVPEDYKLDELQDTFDSIIEGEYDFSFRDYIEEVQSGEEIFSLEKVISEGVQILSGQWEAKKGELIKLILLGVLAGIFCNFSDTFGRKEIGETGFFIVYILLITTLAAAFFTILELVGDVLGDLLIFMKALIPTLSLTLAASSGTSTSLGFYQIILIGMLVVEFVLLNVLVPMVSVYFMLSMANQLTHDNGRFTKMAELIHSFLTWSTKTLLGFVVGFQGIQMLILPVMDQVKRSVVFKTAGSLPGIGNAMNAVTETVIGTTMLLKSAIGIGGVIGICLVCAYPLIKICIFTAIYRIGAAVAQPISDRRIVQSIYITSESGKLLLNIVFSSCLLFLCSIVIVVGITNR